LSSKERFIKIKQYILGMDKIIKFLELIRRLYIYPKSMLGREGSFDQLNEKAEVLVFAAHPDDDILGLSATLIRHVSKGDSIKVVFVTNGTRCPAESWRTRRSVSTKFAEIRHNEAIDALSIINMPAANVMCLGYPDGGTQRYIKWLTKDVQILIRNFNPGRIYVHSIEGGHVDHDMTSLVVKFVCQQIGYSNLFEWAEYNPKQSIGTEDIKFINETSNNEKTIIKISNQERILKRKMLACHKSQNVERFYLQGEALRQANTVEWKKELNGYCKFPQKKLNKITKSLIHDPLIFNA
jgi:LmbE family N-acetylglucosaminyl deacetylase